MAQTSQEEQRRRRRKRLVQGLLMGSAAIGLPALLNSLVARRARRLPSRTWGHTELYDWDGTDVAYHSIGPPRGSETTAPIVLLHSLGPGHSSVEWRRSAELLGSHSRILAPDLPGWGRSPEPQARCDSELYLRFVGDFLEDVVGEPAVLVAAGLTAAFAVQIALDHPDRVAALGLVVPTGIETHGDEPDLKDAIVHWLLRLPIIGTSALNLYTSRAGLQTYLQNEIYAEKDAVDEDVVDQHYRSSHRRGSHAALAAFLSGYLNHGVHDVLDRVECETWLAWGRHAKNPPVENADLWIKALPQSALDVFEQSAALPHHESAEEFARKLELFLER